MEMKNNKLYINIEADDDDDIIELKKAYSEALIYLSDQMTDIGLSLTGNINIRNMTQSEKSRYGMYEN